MKKTNAWKVVSELLSLGRSVTVVERACVAAYMVEKGLRTNIGSFLANYIKGIDADVLKKCSDVLNASYATLDIEALIELFELLVTDNERKRNGVAYTPLAVKEMMLSRIFSAGDTPTVFDPSCGCASFLLTAAKMIHARTRLPYGKIIENCIFGADVDGRALEKTKALFALLIAENGDCSEVTPELFEFNMLKKSSIATILEKHPGGFDCVIGNPPYVRARNMDAQTRADVIDWSVSACGNVDMYMPFFEVGMTLVSDRGFLSYITSNTYLQSVNGRCLRNWMMDNKFSIEITDFRNAQLFANVTCYTCVTVLSRQGRAGIEYRRAKNPKDNRDSFSHYPFSAFAKGEAWRMRNAEVDAIIKRLEGCGKPLSDYTIRNGVATLANNIYFFKPVEEDGMYFYREFGRAQFKIEKALCRKVVKPNIVHSENELQSAIECAIFPYEEKNGRYVVIPEDEFRLNYPCAYRFLSACRHTLDKRDKGKGKYPAWYAYGRTQGMNFTGSKLLLPYIAGSPTAVLSTDRDLMFYCGYALLSDNIEELRYLKVFLESEAFWYYIYHTSKPYSKGFMAFAKNYIVRFSIPQLNKTERTDLLSAKSVDERNALVWNAFGIDSKRFKPFGRTLTC